MKLAKHYLTKYGMSNTVYMNCWLYIKSVQKSRFN